MFPWYFWKELGHFSLCSGPLEMKTLPGPHGGGCSVGASGPLGTGCDPSGDGGICTAFLLSRFP